MSRPHSLSVVAAGADDRALPDRTLAVAVALFLTTASFVLARTGRDALYFQAGGIRDLPFAYMGMAVLSLPMAAGALALMRRVGARRARLIAPATMVGFLLVYGSVAESGGGAAMTALFLLVPLAYGVLFSMVWLLGADLIAVRQPERRAAAYGRLGAASLAGSLAGAGTARLLATSIEPGSLLVMAAGTLASAVAVIALTQRRYWPATGRRPPPIALVPGTLATLFQSRYFRLLLIVGASAALAGVLVEFRFYLTAAVPGRTGQEAMAVFANIYLALSLAAFVAQLTITARLQRRGGPGALLLVLPATLALLSPAAVVSASMVVSSVLRMAEGGLKSSIHRVGWEQAYLALAPGSRGPAKLIVDGATARMSEGVAALLLHAWLRSHPGVAATDLDASWMAYALVAVALVWVLATRALTAVPVEYGPDDEGFSDLRIPDS